MIFSLSLPYRVGKADRRAFARDASITAFLLRTAARTKHERMSQSDRRIWGRLQDKLLVQAGELPAPPAPMVGRCLNCRAELSEPITDTDYVDTEVVELDRTELDWLLRLVKETDLPADLAAWQLTLQDALEVALDPKRAEVAESA